LGGVVLFVLVGTLGNYLLDAYLGIQLGHSANQQEIAALIESGAPDVDEALRFFDSFLDHKQYTYGAQFVGGLIPMKSVVGQWIPLAHWNPWEWSLAILYGTDDEEFLSTVRSGGLRIPLAISGYAAFGWWGVLFTTAGAGFLTGYLVRFAKRYAG